MRSRQRAAAVSRPDIERAPTPSRRPPRKSPIRGGALVPAPPTGLVGLLHGRIEPALRAPPPPAPPGAPQPRPERGTQRHSAQPQGDPQRRPARAGGRLGLGRRIAGSASPTRPPTRAT